MFSFLKRTLGRETISGIYVEDSVSLDRCTVLRGARIGFRSYANESTIRGSTTIGRYCSIGRRCSIGAAHHPLDWLTTHAFGFGDRTQPEEPTVIGNDVWIGDNVVVIGGITISDGAVVGAGSVVTKDVPPYAIVAGVPARPLRRRFDDATIDRLLKLKWWEIDPSALAAVPFSDVAAALSFLTNLPEDVKRLPDHHRYA